MQKKLENGKKKPFQLKIQKFFNHQLSGTVAKHSVSVNNDRVRVRVS